MVVKKNKKKKITRSVTMSLNRDKELKMYKKINRHFDITKEKSELINFINTVMQKVSSKLMDLGIKHILNFDAIYTTKSNFMDTLFLFKEVSTNLYGRPINIDWNKDLIPNPIHN